VAKGDYVDVYVVVLQCFVSHLSSRYDICSPPTITVSGFVAMLAFALY
jgi:hypothetical protein